MKGQKKLITSSLVFMDIIVHLFEVLAVLRLTDSFEGFRADTLLIHAPKQKALSGMETSSSNLR